MLHSPISLCMMIRDEESHLADCLSSVRDVVSEIIVVDTGSTDRSFEIAQQFGAKVIQHEWNDDFSLARNVGLMQATCPWILCLDADERLQKPDFGYLDMLLGRDNVMGYYIQFINYLGNIVGSEFVTDSACRLFRNNAEIRFSGQIHETVVPNVYNLGGQIEFCGLRIVHYGYLSSELNRKNKYNRNVHIIQSALERHPKDIVLRYALGVEYFQLENYQEALGLFLPLLTEVSSECGYACDLVLKTAYCIGQTGDLMAAVHVAEDGLQIFPDFVDLMDLQAYLKFEMGDLLAAKEILGRAIDIGDVSHKYTSVSGCGTYRSRFLMGLVCERLGQVDEACDHYRIGLKSCVTYVPIWNRFIAITLSGTMEDELMSAINEHQGELTGEIRELLMRYLVHFRRPHFAKRILRSYPTDFQDPLLVSVLEVQSLNPHSDAESLFILTSQHPELRLSSSIYLWALALKHQDQAKAQRMLEHIALQCDVIGNGIAPATHDLQPAVIEHLPHHVLTRLQAALVHIGAWNVLLYKNLIGYRLRLADLPKGMVLALLDAPFDFRNQLVETALEQTSGATSFEITSLERRVFGLMALETNHERLAFQLFQAAYQEGLNDLTSYSGYAKSCFVHAQKHASWLPLRASRSNVRFFAVSEILDE